jgi:Zn finger protein HypA/HybF involved in hydrogenase expression
MFNLDEEWIEINCPKCTYSFEIQMIDVRLETINYCPNCKCSIQLKDQNASVYTSTNDINNALNELDKTIKNLFK